MKIMLRHNSRNGFFQIFEVGNIFEKIDQKKSNKRNFCQNVTFLAFFGPFWS